MARWLVTTIGLVFVLALAAACGGDDDGYGNTNNQAAATPRATASKAAASSAAAGVTGQLELSGPIAGTFSWNNLAINNCFTNLVDVTMSDGKDTFISISGNDKGEIRLASAKLPSVYDGKGANLNMKADGLDVQGLLNFDGTLTGSGAPETVKGKLTIQCP
jgi:hypothetical protein